MLASGFVESLVGRLNTEAKAQRRRKPASAIRGQGLGLWISIGAIF
jgi:hypothetical protein